MLAVPLAAQHLAPRWELEVRGRVASESGDLRIDGNDGRLLLEHSDSAYAPIRDLQVVGQRVTFALPAREWAFDGMISDSNNRISGTIRTADGDTLPWRAWRLPPDSRRWPVPPRVTIAELVVGTADTVERIPGKWLDAAIDTSALEQEYRALAAAAGMPALKGAARVEQARRVQLGLDPAMRAQSERLLRQIAQSPAADDEFRALFFPRGRCRCDFQEAMVAAGPYAVVNFSLDSVAKGLRELGELAPGADTLAIFEVGWRLWARSETDSGAVNPRLDSLLRVDFVSGNQVRAMFASYHLAAYWWERAVTWLVRHRWLDTADGPRSPAELMAQFWGADSVPMPAIRQRATGEIAAMPTVDAAHLGPLVLRAANATAREWQSPAQIRQLMDAWLSIRWDGPLPLDVEGRALTMVSPYTESRARPASFFGDSDAIVIDPAISPIAAVATFIHEWQHWLVRTRRLVMTDTGATHVHAAGVLVNGATVQVREDDPWLAEGFAEWATDAVLQPVRGSGTLLLFTQAAKRLASADRDDPHLLGYQLVRAAVMRAPKSADARDLLVASMHDLAAVAHASGLQGGGRVSFRTFARPANASVVPEITFTFDDDMVLELSRRLVISPLRPEH